MPCRGPQACRRPPKRGPRLAVAAVVALLAAAGAPAGAAEGAPPRTALDVIDSARAEGVVVVYSTTDRDAARPLLDAFSALYPEIRVDYRHLYSSDLYARFRAEARSGPVADVLWSSAMDLQIKLANDGFALAYRSAEADALPEWATWRDEAWGTTFEPIGFAYDRRALSADEVPATHRGLARMLHANAARLRGKVGSYDPERSGIGCLLLTQDSRLDPSFDELLRAYGEVGLRGFPSSIPMLDALERGDLALAVDVIGPYVRDRQRRVPTLGVVYPADYTLVLSRIALIARAAPHPDAARVFLDFLLSERGQSIAAEAGLGAVRADVAAVEGALAPPAAALRPIPVRPSVLVYVDRANRVAFLRRWRRGVGGQ